ncbi:MAG: DnaD domain protein [Acholeplasma sp.]|nr:DnaD domain protein [Acholeplasma sp.]
MKVNSKFKVFMQTDLSASDFKVLTMLYQPLIGAEAYAIYSTFYHLAKKSDTMSHQMFIDLLNIKLQDFSKYREKIEAFGLLETYANNEDEYTYVLKPPFSAKQFFVDTFLGTYLESEIGPKNLERLIKMFVIEKPNTKDLVNITKSFDDLYEFKTTKLLNVDYDLEGRNGNSNKLIRNSINYDEFVKLLPRALVSTNLLNNKFKQKIMQLAYVYQFSIHDLVAIYEQAHKGKKNITIEQINLQARAYYEKNNNELVALEKNVSEDALLSELPCKVIIEKYASQDPEIQARALATVNDFIGQNDIDHGVLNVLLMFILKNKDGLLPHVNYLNKVWESWRKNGVQTASDAILYKENVEKYWKTKNEKNTKKINKPNWLDEYLDEISEMEG